MNLNRTRGAVVAALCAAALVVGGAAAVIPAASAKAGINWGHIWKTQLQPRADQRYYTKKQVYSRAQAGAKFAPKPTVIRGTYGLSETAAAAGELVVDNVGFGVTLSSAPNIHYIKVGDAVPAGCSGTAAAPNAAPGNLCVFESFVSNSATRGIYDPSTAAGLFDSTSAFGTGVYAYSDASGPVLAFGTWALAPAGLSSSRTAPSPARGFGPGLAR